MWILQKFRNPLNWIFGIIVKNLIRKLFLSKIENKDFNNLFSYILELLPNETIINTIKLLYSTFYSKPSELFNLTILRNAMLHTLPQNERMSITTNDKQSKFYKYLFIFLILSNILKRFLFIFKNIILMPFRLGVYGFIAFLFGIKVDWLLSFFDIFKFNLPSWTYHKLVELHISWMGWFRETLNIRSINTELNSTTEIPKLKRSSIIIESEPEINSDTYLYLTKKQWLYLGITVTMILGAYFGYTGGIPFSKTFDWSSGGDNRPDDDQNNHTGNENRGDLKGKRSLRNIYANPRGLDFPENDSDSENNEPHNTWQDTFTNWTSRIINKINPYNWFTRTDAPNINIDKDNPNIADKWSYEQWKNREANDQRKWLEHLNNKESESNKELSGLESFIRDRQLERQGHLSELEREDLRKEYLENRDKNSPTHPDPETAKEYKHLFQYESKGKDSSTQSETSGLMAKYKQYGKDKAKFWLSQFSDNNQLETSVGSSNSRDSSETVRPAIKDNSKASITTSESNSEGLGEHTYPPQAWRVVGKIRRKPVRFSELSDTPFAKGYTEKLDTSKPPVETYDTTESGFKPNPSPSVEVEKGSVMFSARFADNFHDEWRDDQ